jgi:tetratricopeptide (TPR) repeat protein
MFKVFIYCSVFLTAVFGIGSYFYFTDEAIDRDELLGFFQTRRYAEALHALEKNKKGLSQDEYLLYRSYLAEGMGKRSETVQHLKQIVHASSRTPNADLLAEAYLNLMLNEYLNEDMPSVKKYLFQSQYLVQNSRGWFPVFFGLVAYCEGDYLKALNAWESSSYQGYLSPWMEQNFAEVFDSYWFANHRIQCHLGSGNIGEARRLLEHFKPVFDEGHKDEFLYLNGLGFILEAESQTYDMAIPYYRSAIGRFARIRTTELIKRQKEELLPRLHRHIEKMMQEGHLEYLSFYVQLLEEWGGEEEIAQIRQTLIGMLDQELWNGTEGNLPQLVSALAQLLKDCRLRNEIALRFEHQLEMALQKNEVDFLQAYWQMILAFREEDAFLNGKFSDLAIHKTLQSIFSDDDDLSKTMCYLNFYRLVEDKPEDSRSLAVNLVTIADHYWSLPDQRGKAMQLLKAAKNIAPIEHVSEIQNTIEDLFKVHYANALLEDQVAELFDLLAVVDGLELANLDIQNRQELQGQLEDAEYLYMNGRLREAKNKTEWILTIDPENQRARRLMGMIAYYFADYKTAQKYLEGIVPGNNEMREAQAVSAILLGDTDKGRRWLEEVERSRPVKEEIYLRLVYGFLSLNNPKAAQEWLEKLPPNQSEVLPARIVAAFEMDSWNEVIDLFDQLQPPYKHLDGFHGLLVESLTALGNEEEAGATLDRLLKKPPEPFSENFTPYFQTFKKERLDLWNRMFVAGIFFKLVKQDPERALYYFNRIDNPSLLAQLEKAELYFQLGRTFEAKDLLLEINYELPKENVEFKLRILPLLGQGFENLGLFAESIPFFEEYFTLVPDSTDHRKVYTRVLMHLRRYDLALEQLRALRDQRELDDDEFLIWITCLVHRGEFDKANNEANQWLSDRQVGLSLKLRLAQLMIITDNRALLEYIVKAISEPSQRSPEDNQELVRLWMTLGLYNQAVDLTQSLERVFEQTPEGLMVLAELSMRLSRKSEALAYAEKAIRLDPINVRATEFIEQYEQRPDIIAQRVKLLRERLEQNPNSVTLQIEYAKNLIELAVEAYLADMITDIDESHDLQQARLTLEKIVQFIPKLPEVHMLLGKVYYLTDLIDKAEQSIAKAVALDPSYVEAYQYLAVAFEKKDNLDEAVAALEKASVYGASNAGVWKQLADLYVKVHDRNRAIEAYKSAIRFSPFEPDSYIGLASQYLLVKKPKEAIAVLQGLLAFSSENLEGLSLMLKALYDPVYIRQTADADLLNKKRIEYYDRLRMLDPEKAKEALPKGADLDPKN